MSITHTDCFDLIEVMFREECDAMRKSKENSGYLALLQRGDKRMIRKNLDGIAKRATQHYIENYDPDLEEDAALKAAFNDCLDVALRAFRQ